MKLRNLILPRLLSSSQNDSRFDHEVTGITANASQVQPGYVFFAIKGTSRDGHAFIPEAIQRGALACIVSEPTAQCIEVTSTRKAYAYACHTFFGNPSEKLKLIGVTGTNGKTTITFFLQQLFAFLKQSSGIIGTTGAYLNEKQYPLELTTPDSFQLNEILRDMVAKGAQTAAMEVSSIAIDQERSFGLHFSEVIFTNLTQDHLDYHQSMENYFETKKRLFTEYPFSTAIINMDDPAGEILFRAMEKNRRIGYSLKNPEADLFGRAIPHGVEIKCSEGTFESLFPIPGEFNLYNLLAALGVLIAQGKSPSSFFGAIPSLVAARGRLEKVVLPDGVLGPAVFVDYAHTPDALKKAILALSERKGGQLWTLFGCGGDRDRAKRPIMGAVAAELSDWVVVTSDNPRTEKPEGIVEDIAKGIAPEYAQKSHTEVNREAAIYYVLQRAKAEDTVLIAGKGHETYQIIGDKKHPFDDRRVVQDYYLNS